MIIYDNITNSIYNYHINYIKHLLIFVNRVKNVDFVSFYLFCDKFGFIWRHIKFTSKILFRKNVLMVIITNNLKIKLSQIGQLFSIDELGTIYFYIHL